MSLGNRLECLSVTFWIPRDEPNGIYLCSMELPTLREKQEFLDGMEELISDAKAPWFLTGDLNEIIKEAEKFGGRSVGKRKLFLQNFLDKFGGVDLGYNDRKFTWDNNQEGMARIKERLEWGVATKEWLDIFPNASVSHLTMEESDHCLILVQSHLSATHNQDLSNSSKHGPHTSTSI